ncbi:MAG: hypothetical protein AVDCRST_MAG25-1927 [uncultured Rubrobacteraceae bacterium]|uniref:Uncharacterized protein n=1 Tax=uncultured Rubrobacteraceae bacterium TaxID=349277 RepID=A0A6J4RD53_9ACTN|nr:MAG: hypothetical protein AVDCRST_MAG25-1927 [uncultured Rubrobacteraceae bacterium]
MVVRVEGSPAFPEDALLPGCIAVVVVGLRSKACEALSDARPRPKGSSTALLHSVGRGR